MEKYKLIGISEYAKRHLACDDLESLESMVGSEISESEEKHFDGGKLFIMSDGELTHIDFLDIVKC